MSKDLLKELVRLGEETGTITITDDPTPAQLRSHFLNLSMTIGVLLVIFAGG